MSVPQRKYDSVRSKIFALETNPKLSLERVNNLLKKLNLRKKPMKVIQVVGTNGKGSTCAFLESILMHQGIKVGVFTSPHLVSARERIRINQVNISAEDFIKSAQAVFLKSDLMDDKPSFFEVLLVMAIWYFEEQHVDVAVLEAGIGGRLDATTVCNADILGVSSISLDHLNILGDTLEKIAFEKISAAHKGQTVVSLEQVECVWRVIEDYAKKNNLTLIKGKPFNEPSSLPGEHQFLNAGLALELIKALGYNFDVHEVKKALLKTKHMARCEVLSFNNKKIIIDGAHNPDGMKALFGYIHKTKAWNQQKWQLVYSAVDGHDILSIVKIIKEKALEPSKIFLAKLKNSRGLSFEKLKEIFVTAGFDSKIIYEFNSMDKILLQADTDVEFTLVCGSLYLAGEIRSQIIPMDVDEELVSY